MNIALNILLFVVGFFAGVITTFFVMKNIAANPELKEFCEKNPQILGTSMDKDWMK